MNKQEQIINLLNEWCNEDSDNRTVSLTMITAAEEGEELTVNGVLNGVEDHLISCFYKALIDKSNPLQGILHKAYRLYMTKGICAFIDTLSKGIEGEPADGSENATEGGKSSENNDNE